MSEGKIVFSGQDYHIWGFSFGHSRALLLYNNQVQHMLEFGQIGYLECPSSFNGFISIRTGINRDVSQIHLRTFFIDQKGLLVIEYNNYEYIIECRSLRSCTFANHPNKTDSFAFRNTHWDVLWRSELKISV